MPIPSAPNRGVTCVAFLTLAGCTGALAPDGASGPGGGGHSSGRYGDGNGYGSGGHGSTASAGATVSGTGGGPGPQTTGQGGDSDGAGAAGGVVGGAVGTGGGAAGTGGGGTSGAEIGGGGGGGAGATGGRGTGGAGGGGAGAGSAEIPAGWVPALVGVGYGGIRIVSRDAGRTWGDRAYETANGGDDDVLLRAVIYGKGLWVATGWKLMTSTDAVRWTDHGKLAEGPIPACGIVEGLAYKDGTFYAACTQWDAPVAVFRSPDGLKWTKHADIGGKGDIGGHVFLTYRDAMFVVYGDTKTSFKSTDALTWTVMPGVEQATYCDGAFKSGKACLDAAWFDGVWLRADWQGGISRSTDGKTFGRAYLDDQKNTLYQSRALTPGYVPPR
ncbi:MAG: hypothetical protein ABI560_04715 [Myxococcales bacterium]